MSFLHHHHNSGRPTEQGLHGSAQRDSHVDDKADGSAHHHHHLFGHHKEGKEKPHHRPSQAEIDNAEFSAAREYDHAMKGSHGAGVGFEGARQ